MKAVDVFCRVDRFENSLCVDLFWERELDEDAVDIIVAIELVNEFEHFVGGDGSRSGVQPTGEGKLLAGGDLAFDVKMRGGIVSNEDGGEAGLDVLAGEAGDFGLEFGEDLVADFESIQDACGHANLTFIVTNEKDTTSEMELCHVACTSTGGGDRSNLRSKL
jgi:hypothetical protein